MNAPTLYINGKRWIDCPEPVSYAAADYATSEGYKSGSQEWWNAYRWFKAEALRRGTTWGGGVIVCLAHPTLPEFTCCGVAFDVDESDAPPTITSYPRQVTCGECLRVIRAFKAIKISKDSP